MERAIKPKYEHTKFGNFMFNICAKGTEFIVKHRVLYYILAYTWGLLLTLVGLFVTLVLCIAKIFTKRISFGKYNWVYFMKAGPDYGGGFETGLMFCRDQDSNSSLNAHEFGHTFQNTLLGPLQVLLSLSSAIRYWYQTFREWHGKTNKAYDSYWLEDAATQCGEYADGYINHSK